MNVNEGDALATAAIKDVPEAPADAGRWLSAFSAAILLTYAGLLLYFFDRVGTWDHDHALAVQHQQYWNYRLWGMEKQWSPVMCGGMSLAANPLVHFFSFSMALGYVIGPFWGLRVAAVTYLVLGWVGAYLYAGLWLRRRDVRRLAASLFIGNGYFLCRLGFGHLNLVPFLVMPLAFYGFHRLPRFAARVGSRLLAWAIASLLLGGGLALVMDGSPQAFLHFAVWIALYAAALAAVRRTPDALVVYGVGAAVAAVLDLGYLWPAITAAREFPRHLPDDFVNPLVFLFFLIVPSTGKVIPTRHFGHEMSVFIGPVIAWLIWRRRRTLLAAVPREVRVPWLVTGAVSFLLGLGSLRLVGVPRWLSPFDILRPLPGFESMGVTARYWGFLAVPLSMLGAAALADFVEGEPLTRGRRWALGVAIALQVGFQVGVLNRGLADSRHYAAPLLPTGFVTADNPSAPGEPIEFVHGDPKRQSAYITPTQGCIECYDDGDSVRGMIVPGRKLLQSVVQFNQRVEQDLGYEAVFKSWTWIRMRTFGARSENVNPDRHVLATFNQSYNGHWESSHGRVVKTALGNLGLAFTPADVGGRIDLRFDDPASRRGAAVSIVAWRVWLALAAAGLIAVTRRSPSRARPGGSDREASLERRNNNGLIEGA